MPSGVLAPQRDPLGRADFVHFDFSGTSAPLRETTDVIVTTAAGVGKPINTGEAVRLIRHLIRALPFDERRISASGAWERVKTKPPNSGRGQRVATTTGTLGESAAAAEMLGLTPSPVRPMNREGKAPWAEGYEVQIPYVSEWSRFMYMVEIAAGVDPEEVERKRKLGLQEVLRSLHGKEAS